MEGLRRATPSSDKKGTRGITRWMLLALVLVASSLPAGCRSGASGNEEHLGNALPRDSVDRETVSMLIESQNALRQGALRAALVLADSTVQRAPRLADAHFQRGRVLSEIKRFEEAEEAYQTVLSLDPGYQGVRYNLGNNAYRRQHYRDAVEFYREEQARHPSPSTLVSMGWTYVALGEEDSARQAYERAIALDSTHTPAHARLGQLYEDEGDLEAALRHSQRALELDPDNARYRYVVGTQLHQLGRSEEAIDYLESATEERPWHQGAHYNLGQALMRVGRQDDAELYLAKADSLESTESEIEQLQSVARNNPENPTPWRNLGAALHETGRLEEAQNAYQVALYLNPNDPTLRNHIAMLAADRENYETALAHYQALLQQHPDFEDGWFNLGVVYARKGETKKAEQVWQRVLQQNPDHQRAKDYLARLTNDS